MKISHTSELLTRAVEEVIVREHLEEVIASGNKLRVKFGIDPTAPDIHLGHTVPLRKLRAFQDAGHQAVLIIGDFTATVGDPSGRDDARKPLSEEDIQTNLKEYLSQAGKVIDLEKTEVRYNSEWYKKMGVAFLYDLLAKVTVQRALERDDFQKRIAEGRDITVLEMIYPLLQGYDSVAVAADVELGGTDQKFNLLTGRKIQRRFGQPQQDVMTTWLMEGTDGGRKMSKSLGNYIGLRESAGEMFGKIMSIPDNLIVKYFIALTDVPMSEIEAMEKDIASGTMNPRDAKMALGERIAAAYHGEDEARQARERFVKVFSQREMPNEMQEFAIQDLPLTIVDVLVQAGLAASKSEARRLIEQGAVEIDGKEIRDLREAISSRDGQVIKVGKRRFLKIKSE
ncbi:MAG: tyrosine--tRNA ligase [Candidatus Sungbacteria bacterium RIFCSPLOWO2_01_FULL_54_21]|uniref:Tyrosine--tRNA ligase n=2 Tax=Candidatus Sungiibacteriota TaxID=1817917 RepID=A0A1G2L9L3_9BACT|nr:MAG: tyrosine--tRNA ligase [Candidatus Sungbacteria bacterium RIFCSPHIGHO2_01_FULL_54_26]OHA02908.1 MAG: tyrosine--tRNA ligase [Candidatus Sungbacteria bacterium RIFCSPHIGHO2_02_FULL_53_17]OHA07551.1 MAG: tyrosine--tRNA ligase [Candidatus Sungbacteria bacterium RIFCSPLOWO2_01_FULL_54_21]